MLFYLPLVLGSFWFGFKGSIAVASTVSILFFPYLVIHWDGFSIEDFDKILEGMLYITIALILGLLIEKERKAHRAKLQSENLAAVGRAVSELAHDIKTPLMAIGGFANQVKKKFGKETSERKKLDIVVRETERLESMVQEMLLFGKPLDIQPVNTDINGLVSETVKIARPMIKKNHVDIVVNLDPSVPLLMIDAPKVKQVMLNLVTNAIHASSAGDRIIISTNLNGNGVIVSVSDSGCGVEEKDQENIFRPFFSTKKGGTGLGLANVKKIIELHEGKIWCDQNQSKGMTFTIQLQ
jgi:signal transduction histidine kinase